MGSPNEFAKSISRRFKDQKPSVFPTRDISLLIPDDDERDLFHFQIEMFLSGVAGYSSGAWQIHREPIEKLKEARRFLSQSFFEKHPEYERYRALIQPNTTPNLFKRLEDAEHYRIDVLRLLDELLSSQSNATE